MHGVSRTEVVLNYTILILLAAIAIYPIVGILGASLLPPGTQPSGFSLPSTFDFHNFATAWTQFATPLYHGMPLFVDVLAERYPEVPIIITKMVKIEY